MTKDIDQETGQGVTGKVCTKCGEWKLLVDYGKSNRLLSGRTSRCKTCTAAYSREYRSKPENMIKKSDEDRKYRLNPDVISRQAASRATPEFKSKRQEYLRKYLSDPANREKIAEYKRQYYSDPEAVAKNAMYHHEYQSKPENKAKKVAYDREYTSKPDVRARRLAREREYRETPDGKAARAHRSLVSRILKQANKEKKSRTAEVLGYTSSELRSHIELQFSPNMSWENYSRTGWHIDHIKPIAAFLTEGVTDPKIVSALSNLQPMWAKENISKSDRWPIIAANDNDKQRNAA